MEWFTLQDQNGSQPPLFQELVTEHSFMPSYVKATQWQWNRDSLVKRKCSFRGGGDIEIISTNLVFEMWKVRKQDCSKTLAVVPSWDSAAVRICLEAVGRTGYGPPPLLRAGPGLLTPSSSLFPLPSLAWLMGHVLGSFPWQSSQTLKGGDAVVVVLGLFL